MDTTKPTEKTTLKEIAGKTTRLALGTLAVGLIGAGANAMVNGDGDRVSERPAPAEAPAVAPETTTSTTTSPASEVRILDPVTVERSYDGTIITDLPDEPVAPIDGQVVTAGQEAVNNGQNQQVITDSFTQSQPGN